MKKSTKKRIILRITKNPKNTVKKKRKKTIHRDDLKIGSQKENTLFTHQDHLFHFIFIDKNHIFSINIYPKVYFTKNRAINIYSEPQFCSFTFTSKKAEFSPLFSFYKRKFYIKRRFLLLFFRRFGILLLAIYNEKEKRYGLRRIYR